MRNGAKGMHFIIQASEQNATVILMKLGYWSIKVFDPFLAQ